MGWLPSNTANASLDEVRASYTAAVAHAQKALPGPMAAIEVAELGAALASVVANTTSNMSNGAEKVPLAQPASMSKGNERAARALQAAKKYKQ